VQTTAVRRVSSKRTSSSAVFNLGGECAARAHCTNRPAVSRRCPAVARPGREPRPAADPAEEGQLSLPGRVSINSTWFFRSRCTLIGPNGNEETGITLTEVGGAVVSRGPNGDLLYIRDSSGTACVSLTTGDVAGSTESEIIGGTGANAGATGPVSGKTVGFTLLAPTPPGFGFLNGFTGTSISTINLP